MFIEKNGYTSHDMYPPKYLLNFIKSNFYHVSTKVLAFKLKFKPKAILQKKFMDEAKQVERDQTNFAGKIDRFREVEL